MAAFHPSRDALSCGSSPINGPLELRQRDSASPVSSYGDDADELMETDKEDELTSEVDRSFSQTLSVSDAFESMPSPQSKPYTTAANKRHGMTLPRRLPCMLHGADDDDDDDEDNEDDEVHGNGYFGAMAPISPTGGGRFARRPALGQASKARTTQLSSRLGQMQRPSAFSAANARLARPEDRPQRAFGRESGRENVVSQELQNQTLSRPSLKLNSRNQTEIGYKVPMTAPLSGTSRASVQDENEDSTFRPLAVKSRPPLPTFTMTQRPSPKRGDVSRRATRLSIKTVADLICAASSLRRSSEIERYNLADMLSSATPNLSPTIPWRSTRLHDRVRCG
jgi:hypothetical protein